MKTLADRLKSLLIEKNISQADLARDVGVAQPTIFKIVNGDTRNPKNIVEIANALGVDPHWLKTGEGEQTQIENNVISAMSYEEDEEHQYCIHQLDAYAVAGRQGFINQEFPDIVRSIYFSQQGLSEIVGINNADGISMISVPTDSMSPTIEKGDIVFIDTRIDCYNGEGIYIFDLDGETYIKRLQKIPFQGMLALSDNERYKPIPISDKDFSSAVIRGKFIRVLPINPRDL
ncbi:XRE family transcriptional regulator [Gallibacterium anatis]|uniref:XRE family transcriptional regulator n=1 Tax=Gallibacterium anatis TaxID=750 RepID=UPI00053103AF|nr:S24 family peptidase [Gallibacterium anatis]KGQ25841.1 repressor [Gallibacterium anatis]